MPLSVSFFYLVLGMITTLGAFRAMPDEIELAIGLEDEELQPALRASLTVLFVLAWPLVLAEMITRR